MKINKIIGIAVVLLLIVVTTSYFSPKDVKALGNTIRSGQNLSLMRTSAATTSPAYISTGKATATSTLTFQSEEFDTLNCNLQLFASTTNNGLQTPKLQINRYASDDANDFFSYVDAPQTIISNASSTITFEVATTSTAVIIAPPQGATTTLALNLKLIPARFTRLEFIVATTTQSTTFTNGMNVWANCVGQSNSNR